MKKLTELLQRNDLLGIWGMTSELGHKTKRTNLEGLKECEGWLNESAQNSIKFIFEDESIDFKLN